MSKFIDRLKKVSQPLPPQMGFRPKSAESARPKIQLVASLHDFPHTPADKLTAADAVVVPDTKSITAEVLCGLQQKKGTLGEVDKAIEAGADFIILQFKGAVVPSDKKIGKILQIDSSVTDVMLRTVNDLPLDAVMVTQDSEDSSAITWQKLMLSRRFSGMLMKPVLVSIPPTVNAEELQLLWEMGVSGVVVDIKGDTDVTALDALRKLINGLQYPSPRKRERLMAVLPQVSAETKKPEEPDEDDDDDD
ncbi:MAG TPA: hypothetical protein VGA85_05245 [Dehalococcoidales bacterium]